MIKNVYLYVQVESLKLQPVLVGHTWNTSSGIDHLIQKKM